MTAALTPAQQYTLGSIAAQLAKVDRPTVRQRLTEVLYPQPEEPMADKATPDEPEEDAGSDRSMDKEVRLMGRLVRMLNEVEGPARKRVVAWLAARFAEE